MRTEGPPVSSELQLGYEDDHQNCSFDISVCGNLTEDYQAVSQKNWVKEEGGGCGGGKGTANWDTF